MAQSPLVQAIKMICEEKNIPLALVVETVEAALAAAYRKDFGEPNQNIKVVLDQETGNFEVFDVKTVVEDVEETPEEEQKIQEIQEIKEGEEEGEVKKRFNPKTEIMISQAKLIKSDAQIGDVIKTQLVVPEAFGRMAAQTAKQVIIQKLREAERVTIYEEFKAKEKEIITGIIQRQEGKFVLVDLGRAIGILPIEGQVHLDTYMPGKRFKFYLEQVIMGSRGPEIRLSRSHPELLKHLFRFEIPEIGNGAIEVMSIAREAGSRSKISVRALQEGIDPIGSCVGQRGTRVQTIISELGGEKIDIILYDEDPKAYISNALAPAKVSGITIDSDKKMATVSVSVDQLSLAIGKSGQNVRLAAKLTGWRVNIKEEAKDEIVAVGDEAVAQNTESGVLASENQPTA